ncbi:hypothetical protein DOTSEDRAFT_26839 [Dothistroma septosporum NZE10]|uniref:Uncharacterized protein n=1 Tax=Dothistroma septosporum (strain NZE10 / CBS 128990) TaxID=675120 RepID=N1PH94_DOTSN|nr:hypothetical protein DOTSEDRAFT_26839 [Dothistroma septosporum NZE10]
MARFPTLFVIITAILFTTLTSATIRVYKDCTPSLRTYVADQLEAAIANIELVAKIRNKPEDRLEMQYFGILNQGQKDRVAETYARALRNRPMLIFTCPKRGSELEKICEGSLDADVADNVQKLGLSLMIRERNELVLCPAPEVGADLAFVNKLTIVSAIIEAMLEEKQASFEAL